MTGLRQLLVVCALALPPALASALWHPVWLKRGADAPSEHAVSFATAAAWGAQVLWVDARSEAEHQREHIPGALLLNDAGWERQVAALLDVWQPERKIVVYCGRSTCDASEHMARRLRTELGLPQVYYLEGGIDSWRRAQPR